MAFFTKLAKTLYFCELIVADAKRWLRRALYSPLDLEARIELDATVRPNYAYGTLFAAKQAKALGYPRISVIEFGVAGGSGLVVLEKIAKEVQIETGVKIDVYGFDIVEGMPEATDYRDLPYVWEKGYFKMDIDALRARLDQAELVLGDVSDTVGKFVTRDNLAPIGFISFDLDYYSSTTQALEVFDYSDELFLPRVYCYFDDCLGDDNELHSPYSGELLAISEFNRRTADSKIAKIHGFRHKRLCYRWWNDVMFACHRFKHPKYCININEKGNWSLPLTESNFSKVRSKLAKAGLVRKDRETK